MGRLRIFKLLVILGFPFLGWLYAFQFSNAFDPEKRDFVVPFKSFKAPETRLCPGEQGSECPDSQRQSLVSSAQSQKQNQHPKLRLVNFWATWCPPCVEEFPAMIELQQQLGFDHFEIVFVSIDESWSSVQEFYKKYQIEVREDLSLWDPSQASARDWGSVKFPESYVVRPDGWVVEKIVGAQQWTRPAVVQYFQDLTARFSRVSSASGWTQPLDSLFGHRAWAQKSSEGLQVDPLIHEQDKKTLEKMRQNIEIASDNLQKAEAALKEENRNLSEQKIVRDRRSKDVDQAQEELSKVVAKDKEIDASLIKTQESLSSEQNEKLRVENQIKSIQGRIKDLEKKLQETRDELIQTQKTLNTRVSSIETLTQAQESTREESSTVKSKLKQARDLVADKRKSLLEVEKDISGRERKAREITTQVDGARKELENQKKKLAEFEQVLKK